MWKTQDLLLPQHGLASFLSQAWGTQGENTSWRAALGRWAGNRPPEQVKFGGALTRADSLCADPESQSSGAKMTESSPKMG